MNEIVMSQLFNKLMPKLKLLKANKKNMYMSSDTIRNIYKSIYV